MGTSIVLLWLDSGIAEMLAMEMKSCGAYVSRSLSFKQAEVCHSVNAFHRRISFLSSCVTLFTSSDFILEL